MSSTNKHSRFWGMQNNKGLLIWHNFFIHIPREEYAVEFVSHSYENTLLTLYNHSTHAGYIPAIYVDR